MSTHRFPSVLDDAYEKQLYFPEQSALSSTNNIDVATKSPQQTDPKYGFV